MLVSALGVLRATGRPVPLLVVLGGPSGRSSAVKELPGARVHGRRPRRRRRAPAGRPRHPRALVPRGRRRRDAVAQRVVRARRRRGPGQRCPGGRGVRRRAAHDRRPRRVRPAGPRARPRGVGRRDRRRAGLVRGPRAVRGGRAPGGRAVRLGDHRRPDAQGLLGGRRGPGVARRSDRVGRPGTSARPLRQDGRHDLHPRAAPPRRERVERQEPVHRLGRRAPLGEGHRGGRCAAGRC